jgi:hypothetical protein
VLSVLKVHLLFYTIYVRSIFDNSFLALTLSFFNTFANLKSSIIPIRADLIFDCFNIRHEGMLVVLRKLVDLGRLRLGYITSIDPTRRLARGVHG